MMRFKNHKNERRKGSTAILQQQQHNSYIHCTLQKSDNNNDNNNNNNNNNDDDDNDFPVMNWCEKQTDLALLFNHAISIPLEKIRNMIKKEKKSFNWSKQRGMLYLCIQYRTEET